MNNKKLKDVCFLEKGKTPIQQAQPGDYPLVVTAEERLTTNEIQFHVPVVCIPLVSSTGHGHASIKRIHYQETECGLGNILCGVYTKDENVLLTKYLYIYLSENKDKLLVPLMKGSANVSMSVTSLQNLEIVIPDIEIQKQVVEKYDNLNKKIQMLLNKDYDLQELKKEFNKSIITAFFTKDNLLPIDDIFNIEKGELQSSKATPGEYDFITAASEWKTNKTYTHECEALIYAVGAEGSLGRTHYVNGKFISSDLCFILTAKKDVDYKLYKNIFDILKEDIVKNTATGTSKKAINRTNFSNYKIPYLTKDEQEEISTIIDKANTIENKLRSCDDMCVLLRNAYINKILQKFGL